ncbi:hypothetical protein BH20VER1_BH20VER1_12550 [soil metagenome]
MSTIRHVQSPFMGAQGSQSGTRSRGRLEMVLAVIIGLVFIYAGALKVWDPVTFATDIENFRILPYTLSVRLAFYLPWLEILCGVALIVGRLRTGAIGILTGLMVIFIVATVAAQIRGLDLNCGCFGKATAHLSFAGHMVIDGALLLALLALLRWETRR